jgi:alpha-beta hydrolase superfamily lysophospholipase
MSEGKTASGTPHPAIHRAASSRGTIVLVHGLGEHGGRYDHVAASLVAADWSVVTYDQSGHGRTLGQRGALSSASAVFDDLAAVIDVARRETHPARLLLLGHSMGGAIAARFVAEELSRSPAAWSRRVDGLILTSPALRAFIPLKDRVAVRVLRWIAPNLTRRNGLDATKISHDPKVVSAYRADPLVHDRVTPRLVHMILTAGDHVRANASRWTVPTLLLWAGDDHLVDAAGSRAFAGAAPRHVVDAEEFPGLYHEILNEAEPARSQVFARLHSWLRNFYVT